MVDDKTGRVDWPDESRPADLTAARRKFDQDPPRFGDQRGPGRLRKGIFLGIVLLFFALMGLNLVRNTLANDGELADLAPLAIPFVVFLAITVLRLVLGGRGHGAPFSSGGPFGDGLDPPEPRTVVVDGKPQPTRKVARHVNAAILGGGLVFAGLATVLPIYVMSRQGDGLGPIRPLLFVYAGALLVAAAVAFTLSIVWRRKDGPAPKGPVHTPLSRGAGTMTFASIQGFYANGAVTFGAVLSALGLALVQGVSRPIGFLVSLLGLALLLGGIGFMVRDERRQGRSPAGLLSLGLATALAGWLVVVLNVAGSDVLREETAAQLLLIAIVALGLGGAWLHFHSQRDRAPEHGRPAARTTGAFVAGALLSFPLMAGALFVMGYGPVGREGDSCSSYPVQEANGWLNTTVSLVAPASTLDGVPDIPGVTLFNRPDAVGQAGIDAPDNTSFLYLRLVDGVDLVVESDTGSGWAPAAGGGADVEGGVQPYGRSDFGAQDLRVRATADNARDGTSVPVTLEFRSERLAMACA